MTKLLATPFSRSSPGSRGWFILYILSVLDAYTIQDIQRITGVSPSMCHKIDDRIYAVSLDDEQLAMLSLISDFRMTTNSDFSTDTPEFSIVQTTNDCKLFESDSIHQLANDILVVENSLLDRGEVTVLRSTPIRPLRDVSILAATPARTPTRTLYAPPALPAGVIVVIVVSCVIVLVLLSITITIYCMGRRQKEENDRKKDVMSDKSL